MLKYTRILVLALFFALTASGARAEYAYLVLQGKGPEQDRILQTLHGPGVTIVYDHVSRNLLFTRQETVVAEGPAEVWKALQPQANSYALLELVRISGAASSTTASAPASPPRAIPCRS